MTLLPSNDRRSKPSWLRPEGIASLRGLGPLVALGSAPLNADRTPNGPARNSTPETRRSGPRVSGAEFAGGPRGARPRGAPNRAPEGMGQSADWVAGAAGAAGWAPGRGPKPNPFLLAPTLVASTMLVAVSFPLADVAVTST